MPRNASILLLVPFAWVLTGCTNPGVPWSPPRSSGGTLPLEVRADWDDLGAAVDRAAPRAAVAPLEWTRAEIGHDRTATVRLLAVDDQVATVTFSGRPSAGPAPIRIDASFGRPDDQQRAAALAGFIAEELDALAGRDIAPR